MATLLLNLRNVPDDEADAVRAVLDAHHIAFYETPQNPFGISAPAIWIREKDQVDHARRLLREYQERRAREARAEHVARRDAGTADTFLSRFLEHPVRTLVYIAICIGLVYLIVRPFFGFGDA